MDNLQRVLALGTQVRIKIEHMAGVVGTIVEDLTSQDDPQYLLGAHRYGVRLPNGNTADYCRCSLVAL